MPVPLLKTAAAAATAFFSTKNGTPLLNQTGVQPTQPARAVVSPVEKPTELYGAYSDGSSDAARRRSYPSLDEDGRSSNGGFDWANGQYGYAPWSDSSSTGWSSSAQDFYRHVCRPCESEQFWVEKDYHKSGEATEDDYISQYGGSNQDKREANTKKCLEEKMAGGFVRGAWVKTMGLSDYDENRWSQIGAGNFHFVEKNCAIEQLSSGAGDAFSNEGVFPEDKGVGGADWRSSVVWDGTAQNLSARLPVSHMINRPVSGQYVIRVMSPCQICGVMLDPRGVCSPRCTVSFPGYAFVFTADSILKTNLKVRGSVLVGIVVSVDFWYVSSSGSAAVLAGALWRGRPSLSGSVRGGCLRVQPLSVPERV